MEQKANAFLEKRPIGSLRGKYAVPCVISLLVAAMLAYRHVYTNIKWGHAQNYDICLDSGTLGIEPCVEIIAGVFGEIYSQRHHRHGKYHRVGGVAVGTEIAGVGDEELAHNIVERCRGQQGYQSLLEKCEKE